MAKKILSVLMCLCIVLCCAACGGDTADTGSSASNTDKTSSNASSKEEVVNKGPHPTLETPWVAVPFTTKQQAAAGIMGGEGSQWPTYISFDQIDGSLAFLGIDVGGMYRSKDGGITWEPCTIGITASASSGAEVDPMNINRVLCVGVDSGANDTHGLYLSTDGGENWKHVNPQKVQGHRDFRHQIACSSQPMVARPGRNSTRTRLSATVSSTFTPKRVGFISLTKKALSVLRTAVKPSARCSRALATV